MLENHNKWSVVVYSPKGEEEQCDTFDTVEQALQWINSYWPDQVLVFDLAWNCRFGYTEDGKCISLRNMWTC